MFLDIKTDYQQLKKWEYQHKYGWEVVRWKDIKTR